MKIKVFISVIGVIFSLISCQKKEEKELLKPTDWTTREVKSATLDSLSKGSTYLSVYSEIYIYSEQRTYDLTVTVSMKNIYKQDTLYIEKAEYYNTEGKLIRSYLKNPIKLLPMETVEIVIDQNDKQGGSGGNFVFDWAVEKPLLEPHFEAVMISTYGQQGLSFTSQGIKIPSNQ